MSKHRKSVCYYHIGDFDGICSAAIVNHFIPRCEFIGIHNSNIELIHNESDQVIIVDITLQEQMINLPDDTIWIDHHQQNIDQSIELGFDHFPGIRRYGTAACILTWEYYATQDIPLSVQLIGDYDVWNINKINVQEFQEGLKLVDGAYDPESHLWEGLLRNKLETDIIVDGRIAVKAREMLDKKLIKDYGYRRELWGYDCLVINTPTVPNFLYYYTDADVVVSYRWGGEYWAISLRTQRDSIDVSKIARKYKGGGHINASAFITNDIEFLL